MLHKLIIYLTLYKITGKIAFPSIRNGIVTIASCTCISMQVCRYCYSKVFHPYVVVVCTCVCYFNSHTHTHTSQDQSYTFQRAQRRTQSFSVKSHSHVRSGSFGDSTKLAPPTTQYGRNHPSRRSKTPTPTSGLQRNQKSGQTGKTGSENGGKLGLSRTTSLGKVNRVRRVEENGTHGPERTAQQKVSTNHLLHLLLRRETLEMAW